MLTRYSTVRDYVHEVACTRSQCSNIVDVPINYFNTVENCVQFDIARHRLVLRSFTYRFCQLTINWFTFSSPDKTGYERKVF